MSTIVAENENWRIRQAEGDNYALTCGKGHFTFYIKGRNEKLVFYNMLVSAKAEMKDVVFLTFGGWFALWLTVEDVDFLLENLPMTEAEKEASAEVSTEVRSSEGVTIQ